MPLSVNCRSMGPYVSSLRRPAVAAGLLAPYFSVRSSNVASHSASAAGEGRGVEPGSSGGLFYSDTLECGQPLGVCGGWGWRGVKLSSSAGLFCDSDTFECGQPLGVCVEERRRRREGVMLHGWLVVIQRHP